MRSNGDGKPVVALDIDGTLGDYHANFLTFADLYFGWTFSHRIGEANPGQPLWEWMGLTRAAYREAKLAYRQGGWKRWMPAYPGASELTYRIRSAGAEVWLCTTRPYLRLDNVDPDTREWLRRNNIAFDALLFDPLDETQTKYDELHRQAGARVATVVEDLPEMYSNSRQLGYPTVLRDQPYNRHVPAVSRRAHDLQAVWAYIEEDLNRWIQ
jgi:uncharacterized HAD superfamily protein